MRSVCCVNDWCCCITNYRKSVKCVTAVKVLCCKLSCLSEELFPLQLRLNVVCFHFFLRFYHSLRVPTSGSKDQPCRERQTALATFVRFPLWLEMHLSFHLVNLCVKVVNVYCTSPCCDTSNKCRWFQVTVTAL